jgi:hypothetical protein
MVCAAPGASADVPGAEKALELWLELSADKDYLAADGYS